MSSPGNNTFFTNDSGSQAGAISYVTDVFADVSLPATNNTGFSTSLSKNPFGLFYGNDDVPRYGPKTLFIKDLILIADRTLWINNKPTYTIVWSESFPSVQGYAFGDVTLVNSTTAATKNEKYLLFNTSSDGVAVNGVLNRVQFIVNGSTTIAASANVVLDGVTGNTINWGAGAAANVATVNNKLSGYVHASTNETKDIHDFRLVANQSAVMTVVGVVAYTENSGANIDLFPGITYVAKSRINTTIGATMALPSIGSSLGGKSVIFKNSSNQYAMSTIGSTAPVTTATGSNGTNTITVTTGTGASFPVGSGFVAYNGTTPFLGAVTAVSTDTLTVQPTLPNAVSGPMYRTWYSNSGYTISDTGFTLAYSIGASQIQFYNGTNLSEPTGAYWLWSQLVGVSIISNVSGSNYPALSFPGASTFVQVDGYFSAAEVEWVGVGQLNAAISVNGYQGYSITQGLTGPLRQTLMSEAGPGWNSIKITGNSGISGIGIGKINLYQKARDYTVTGQLAEFDTLQAYANPSTISATTLALGTYKRYFADQFMLQGPWVRSVGSTHPGGIAYSASGTSCSFHFEYWGDKYSMVGGTGGSVIITLDGASFSQSFNVTQNVATLGFHTLIGTIPGSTTVLSAIDIHRSVSEFKNLQNFNPINPIDGGILSDNSIYGNSKIKDRTITSQKLAQRIVTTDGTDPGIGGICASNINAFQGFGSGSYTDFGVTCLLTCQGNIVKLSLEAGTGSTQSFVKFSPLDATGDTANIQFLRNGTAIATVFLNPTTNATNITVPPSAFACTDLTPGVGLNQYRMVGRNDAGGTITISNVRLVAMEIS